MPNGGRPYVIDICNNVINLGTLSTNNEGALLMDQLI